MRDKPFANKAVTGVGAAVMLATAAPAMAEDVELRNEIRHLKERVDELEQKKEPVAGLPEGVGIGGLVEVEAFSAEGFDGSDESDITLATVELGIGAVVSPWVQTHVLFLSEGDDEETPFGVDEGTITLGNPDVSAFYATAGKVYVPFGNFTTGLISDPLTLELAETNESALQVGFENGGAYGSVYAFNGDTSDDGDDTIEHFGGNVGFSAGGLDAGVGYLSSLGDSELVQEGLATTDLQDYVGGVNAYGIFETGGFTAVAEYVTATDTFAPGELAFNGQGAEPAAFNLEAGYGITAFAMPAEVAVAYQGTDEALDLGLPEKRLLAGLSVSLNHRAALSFEWAHDEDYAADDGGTGEEADTFTAQLAVEF